MLSAIKRIWKRKKNKVVVDLEHPTVIDKKWVKKWHLAHPGEGTVFIPEGALEIGVSAFSECQWLCAVVFPRSLKLVDKFAFYGCVSLKYVITHDNCLRRIGDDAFRNCFRLVSMGSSYTEGDALIRIPKGVESIGPRVFVNCVSISAVHLPASVTNVGLFPFSLCTSLKKINVPCSTTFLGMIQQVKPPQVIRRGRELTLKLPAWAFHYPLNPLIDRIESRELTFVVLACFYRNWQREGQLGYGVPIEMIILILSFVKFPYAKIVNFELRSESKHYGMRSSCQLKPDKLWIKECDGLMPVDSGRREVCPPGVLICH